MSDFVYNVLQVAWPGSRMMGTDTDSTYCKIVGGKDFDYRQDICHRRPLLPGYLGPIHEKSKMIQYHGESVPLKRFFDHSSYPKDSPWYFDDNEGAYGCMKHDNKGIEVFQWCGLKAKMKVFEDANGKQEVTAKGIPGAERAALTVEDYRAVNWGARSGTTSRIVNIRSSKHELGLYSLMKRGLDRRDTKRYIKENWVETVPFGFIS